MVFENINLILPGLWGSFLLSLPLIAAAIVTLIVGFIVGKVVGWVVHKILLRAKVDEYIEGPKPALRLSHIFSVLAKWIIYLVFIQQAAFFLNITIITNFIQSAIGFLFGLIEAALIIIIGYSLASYIKERLITTKTVYSEVVGNILFFLLVYLSIAMALPFVGIDATLVNWILLILIASVGIGLAIAIGWGLRDPISQLAKVYTKKLQRRRR